MIFFGGTLQHLWSVIRPLQHLAVLGLVNVIYPSNLYQFFIGMVEIANLDILFGNQLTSLLFTMRSSEPFNDLFMAFGIDSKNFLLNSGSMILPITPLLFLQFITFCLLNFLGQKYYKRDKFRKLGQFSEKLKISLPHSFLRMLVEGFIEIALTAFLSLYDIFFVVMAFGFSELFDQTVGDLISLGVTIVSLVAVISFPIMAIFIILKSKHVPKITMEEQTSVFYSNLKTNSKACLVYEGISMLNKLLIVLILLAIE